MRLSCGLVAAAILFWVFSGDSQACNVPAFRYALERWPADPYQILVYSETSPAGKELTLLQKPAANCVLRLVDVTAPEGKALARDRKISAFPWIEVFYPLEVQTRLPLWSGPLEAGGVAAILDSPVRSQLSRRLLEGEVAVWVLVKSGNGRDDSLALQALNASLRKASSTLQMPVIGTDQNGNSIEVGDFKSYPVRFGLLEVARSDPREKMLVSSLLESEPDLAQQNEPIAFPVFGRGRALYALAGAGIQESNIMEACRSLLAWCSCEIKAQSPGTDLLISADWSKPYGGRMVEDPEIPPLASLERFIPGQSATERAAPRAEPAAPRVEPAAPGQGGAMHASTACPTKAPDGPPRELVQGDDLLTRNLLYLAALSGLVLVTLTVVVTVKRKNRP
jgi:hypothetical protein